MKPDRQVVETWFESDTVDAIAQLAKERDCSSSAVIREAVRKELQREEIDA